MFGFGKKKKVFFAPKILMTRQALDYLLLNTLRANEIVLITFFSSTRNHLLKTGNDPGLEELIIPADKIMNGSALSRISSFATQGKRIALAERHPLGANEKQLAEKLETNGFAFPLDAFAALDDAIMLQAGGERIKSLMLKMGMKEDEIIEHSMIESSIQKFQEKIAEKSAGLPAQSAEEWFRLNFPFS
jgi:hypothetical protein